jgi:radical SAM-linked protein
VRFDVCGEARFLSHRDTLRLWTRALRRAEVPVRCSQGYNPRPRLSLPLPRPVAVAANNELLAVELDRPVDPTATGAALGEQTPEGVILRDCEPMSDPPMLYPVRATYETPVTPEQASALSARLAELREEPAWPVIRGDGRGRSRKTVDCKPLVETIDLVDDRVRTILAPRRQRWMRIQELLGLLGLDEQFDRARTTRLDVEFAAEPPE